jgi:hypothetical protein
MKKLFLILTTVLLSISAFAQVPSYVPTNGLVGWWPFNGNANDESGNGNNGTVNGATIASDRFGAANEAYSFDGVGDNIQISNLPIYSFLLDNDYSINFWFQMPSLPNGVMSFIGQGDEDGQYQNRFWRSYVNQNQLTNHIRGNLSDPADTKNQITFSNSGNWVMLSMVRAYNGTLRMYLNGILTDTDNDITGLASPFSSTRNLIFGAFLSAETNQLMQFLAGKLDDIGIWNRPLTQCEIQDLYNAELNSLSVNGGPDQEVCEGQSTSLFGTGASTYTWSNNVVNGVGFLPTATSSYILTGTDANGCIGADTVNVVVNSASSSSQTQTALDSYTWPVNGQTYTQSGTYTDTLVNAAGCDSIVTLNLTMSYTGIEELNPYSSKKLLRITDLSGKETPFRKNTVLLFIYEDGTVERVHVGE